MSVAGYDEVLKGPFARYLEVSQQIGGDVSTHSALVERAFQAQFRYLMISNRYKEASQIEQISLLKPTSRHISAIQEFREHHATSQYKNHIFTISESIAALGWLTVSPAPSQYIKEMKDVAQYYANRVLNEWKKKDEKHVDWVKAWVQTLNDLEVYVKEHHATGLVWSDMKVVPASTSFPLLRLGCALPPLALLGDVAEINPWKNTTKNLKKVTVDMQTQPALVKASQTMKKSIHTASGQKLPVFSRDGNKWLIEYQKDNNDLLVKNAEMDNVVYLNKCVDSTLEVKGKINSITVDSCKQIALILESVVSCVELINCQSIQMQVFGNVPSISIDRTDGCQICLSPDSLAVEIISTQSSDMNVLVPKGNGDFTEFPVPVQQKTTVSETGLNTIPVEF